MLKKLKRIQEGVGNNRSHGWVLLSLCQHGRGETVWQKHPTSSNFDGNFLQTNLKVLLVLDLEINACIEIVSVPSSTQFLAPYNKRTELLLNEKTNKFLRKPRRVYVLLSFFHLFFLLCGKHQPSLFPVSGIVLAVTTNAVVPTAIEFPLVGEMDFK